MERKKITTVVLLIAVILIWGIIILKVIHGGRQDRVPAVGNLPQKSVDKVHKDSLKLDYRDPFIGEFARIRQDKKTVRSQIKTVRKEPEQPPVPDFTFKGLIGNGSVRQAMILKNGSLHILGPGETIGEFRVVGIFPEYIIVQSGKYETKVKVR